MKIKHINSPKASIDIGLGLGVEHVRNDIGNTLVAAGFAEVVSVRPAYGTKEWRDERKFLDAQIAPPQSPPTVEWGLMERNDVEHTVVLVKKTACGTTYLSTQSPVMENGLRVWKYDPATLPSDLPASVRKQWFEMTALNHDTGIDRDKLAREQAEQKEKEFKGTCAVLFGRR